MDFEIKFVPEFTATQEQFQLFELPTDILADVEAGKRYDISG